jgi:hypothetical protein
MSRTTVSLLLGLVVFLIGGALLAFVRTTAGAAAGSTCGLAGLALMGWAWWMRSDGAE